jgi:histidinol-phosphatase (PHP family)
MLYDTHMHSFFSGDSDTPPEKQIERAKEIGLSGVIFTDHMDIDTPITDVDFKLDVEKYFPYMKKMADKYDSDSFSVGTGIELGLMPHLANTNYELIKKYSFDYVIGSVHICHGKDPYQKEYFIGRPIREAYLEYFGCVLENLQSYSEFDSLGHLDYVVRYGVRDYGDKGKYSYYDYSDIIDAILKLIIRKDIALEINTGSFRCGMSEPNPDRIVLKRYRELGGRLLTIGADAHIPEHVGLRFDKIPDIIKECGFDSYFIFKRRKPVEIPI